MTDLKGRRVVVVGMAKSGVAAVELLLEHGASVIAMDQKTVANERLAALGLAVQPQDAAAVSGADLVVLSPGVPADADVEVPGRLGCNKRDARRLPKFRDRDAELRRRLSGLTGEVGASGGNQAIVQASRSFL